MNDKPKLINRVILENEALYVSDGKKREWICPIPDPFDTPKHREEMYDLLEEKGYSDMDNCHQVIKAIEHYNNKANQKHYKDENIISDDYKFDKAINAFTDYLDMADQFLDQQPCFYTKEKIWWVWNFQDLCWEMKDKIDILNAISQKVQGVKLFEQKQQTEIMNALTMKARLRTPEEAPKTWVQFKDKIVDIKTEEEFEPSPKYFITNPLAYSLGKSEDTPQLDELFKQWVGKKWKPTLYEIIAYCCLPNYPIHRVFCLSGEGRNGKSTYLKVISKLIGHKNVCSTDMELLVENRFEASKLYRKLACEMGEINSSIFKRTSRIKKLVGDDLMGFEFKGKTGFDDYNYAKLLIATNKLPESTDKTVGFYAKWLIVDFKNQFTETTDILAQVPEEEYENLGRKCIKILKKLLEDAKFTNEGTYAEREARYEARSSPIGEFIKKMCKYDKTAKTPFFKLYKEYVAFCSERGLRIPTKTEVGRLLTAKGYHETTISWTKSDNKSTTVRARSGIKLNEETIETDPDKEDEGINAFVPQIELETY